MIGLFLYKDNDLKKRKSQERIPNSFKQTQNSLFFVAIILDNVFGKSHYFFSFLCVKNYKDNLVSS